MREILFRGKSPVINEWVEGFLVLTRVGGKEIPTIIPLDDLTKTLTEKRWFQVIPSTVGQFTGLTDKNCKKIFEGDVLLHNRTIWHSEKKTSRENQIRVVWFNRCGWEGKLIGGESCSWSLNTLWDRDTFEVIGNIHDNPEFLEGEANESSNDKYSP